MPLKNPGKKRVEELGKYLQKGVNAEPLPYHITIIEHDHVRRCMDALRKVAGDAVIIFDEVHKVNHGGAPFSCPMSRHWMTRRSALLPFSSFPGSLDLDSLP